MRAKGNILKTNLGVLVVLLISPILAGAQDPQIIVAMENAWNRAELQKDASAVGSLAADDFVMTVAEGTLLNKAQLIASVKDKMAVRRKSLQREGWLKQFRVKRLFRKRVVLEHVPGASTTSGHLDSLSRRCLPKISKSLSRRELYFLHNSRLRCSFLSRHSFVLRTNLRQNSFGVCRHPPVIGKLQIGLPTSSKSTSGRRR